MTLAHSASAASPLAVMATLILGSAPKRSFATSLSRVGNLARRRPEDPELSGDPAPEHVQRVERNEPDFAAPTDKPTAWRAAPPLLSAIAPHAHRETDRQAEARLRWPIRDGFSTWAGTGLTSAFAFVVMGICAVVAAEFAPGKAPSALERAAIQAVAQAPTTR